MSDDNMKRIRRKASPTTQVRIRKSDLPLLDDLCEKLQEMNNGMFYSHSDAIGVLISLANQTEYFRTPTTTE